MGWADEDIANDGSDRMIDAVVAIGDVDAIVTRIRAHLDAGADTVCLQLREEKSADPALAALRRDQGGVRRGLGRGRVLVRRVRRHELEELGATRPRTRP